MLAALATAGLALWWGRRRLQRWRHHLPSGSLARAVLPATALGLALWGVESLVFWLLVRILSPVDLGLPAALSIYLLSGTAGMASTLPGGLGVNEATTALLLAQQGIPPAVGVPVAILRRLITPWSVVALASMAGSRQWLQPLPPVPPAD